MNTRPVLALTNTHLAGSLTYLSVTALSLYLPALRARAAVPVDALKPAFPSLLAAFTGTGGPNGLNWRQVVLSTAVSLWATRLGSYLFQRVLADGHDSRFDEIKKSPPKFFGAWMAQATWVSLCLMPILAVNSIPHTLLSTLPRLTATDVVGLGLFAGGFAFEVAADRQKNAWVQAKKRKEHDEEFLTSGLWSKSRHPNYFGESTLCGFSSRSLLPASLTPPSRLLLSLSISFSPPPTSSLRERRHVADNPPRDGPSHRLRRHPHQPRWPSRHAPVRHLRPSRRRRSVFRVPSLRHLPAAEGEWRPPERG